MKTCSACQTFAVGDVAYCAQCGARFVEPLWHLRWERPDGKGGYVSARNPREDVQRQAREYNANGMCANVAPVTWFAVPVNEDAWRKRRQQEEHGIV